jgi:3-hydroxyisobutyrate dehydrogenase-like beta-hydroxyacid dehydrogenase
MSDPTPGHAAIIGFGLMGCDIAAIFLAGGWRVTASFPLPRPSLGQVGPFLELM